MIRIISTERYEELLKKDRELWELKNRLAEAHRWLNSFDRLLGPFWKYLYRTEPGYNDISYVRNLMYASEEEQEEAARKDALAQANTEFLQEFPELIHFFKSISQCIKDKDYAGAEEVVLLELVPELFRIHQNAKGGKR